MPPDYAGAKSTAPSPGWFDGVFTTGDLHAMKQVILKAYEAESEELAGGHQPSIWRARWSAAGPIRVHGRAGCARLEHIDIEGHTHIDRRARGLVGGC